jgi:TM2 domain.
LYCQKCGKETDDNAAFCSSCGASTNGPGGPSNNAPPSYGPNYGNTNTYAPQKSTGVGILLAFLIPGAGHMYAGKITDGIVIFILAVIIGIAGWLFFFPYIIALVLWIWNIYDANKKINEYNNCIRQTGNPPW